MSYNEYPTVSFFILHSLFKKSGLLLQLGQFMPNLLPKWFDNMFPLNNQILTYGNTQGIYWSFICHYVEQILDSVL